MIFDFLIILGTGAVIIGLAFVILVAAKFVDELFDSVDITKTSKPKKMKK